MFSLVPRNENNTPERTAQRLQNQLRVPCGPWLAFLPTTENNQFSHGRIVVVLGLCIVTHNELLGRCACVGKTHTVGEQAVIDRYVRCVVCSDRIGHTGNVESC